MGRRGGHCLSQGACLPRTGDSVKRLDVTSEISTSRRAFCQQACHAASLAALGILLPGCGGNPTGPSGGANVPQLPQLTSTITGGAFTLTIDAASPLNTVGNAALVNASGRGFLVARTGNDAFVALTAHLHARGVHNHRVPEPAVRLPLPRLGLLAVRHQRVRPGAATAADLRHVVLRAAS